MQLRIQLRQKLVGKEFRACDIFTFKNVIFNKADKGKVSVAAGTAIDRSLEWVHSAKTVEVVIQLLVGHRRIYSAYEEFFFSHITEYWVSEQQNKEQNRK